MTPSKITVLIEGDDTEKEAKLQSFSEMYSAGLYETDDGRQFYVDPELIRVSAEEHKAVNIPLQVITHREEMLAKMRWAEEAMRKQVKEQDTNLILPDGYKV